ncbi:hypothetical protein [Niabella drilacis]|uniref:Uncharacterized protein n=1 Tax=Niabella drilacis (strain DSM 25811 / CCM 8410 / CCUG 62505 / LMG 26954 / E90) TaxID=1285928 RepID=A0A1G6LF50_NIADE|nr:hypothetical protein [Niabella drilacis]SDC41859.1 hypothetical protein SAMN04487894_102327 [Niabella drilacis]
MGNWSAKIDANDTFQDVYQNFFDLYNRGQQPSVVSSAVQKDFADMFNDSAYFCRDEVHIEWERS